MAIRVIFPVSILCCIGSMYLLSRIAASTTTTTSTKLLPLSKSVTWWIFVPSWSLFWILFLRLVPPGQEQFQTYPPDLDFGPKYGIVYSNDQTPEETNVAFDPEFNTVTHCLQGVLAPVLAYVGNVILSKTTTSTPKYQCYTYWLVSTAASAMTIYPTYNFVKRVVKSHETFATSSFSNNGAEWALGFLLGVAVGQFVQAAVVASGCGSCWSRTATTTTSLLPGESNAESKSLHDSTPRLVSFLQWLLGSLLVLSVIGSAILFGYTWNNCKEIAEEATECILDPSKGPEASIMIGFALVPFILSVGTFFCMRFP